MIGNSELSDIVKKCPGAEGAYVVFGKPKDVSHPDREDLCPTHMAHSHLVAGVYRGRERFDRRQMNAARFADQFCLDLNLPDVKLVRKIACYRERR